MSLGFMLEIPVHGDSVEWFYECSDNIIEFTLHQWHSGCKKMVLRVELLIGVSGLAHTLCTRGPFIRFKNSLSDGLVIYTIVPCSGRCSMNVA